MTTIKIAVACHKPSELPKNDLFMPVQVGSALAKNRLDMEHDDKGDNISAKNPAYCELTAQYWSWKNVDADYYGLCHYRRYLCFTNVDKLNHLERNLRGHIEAGPLDEYNIKRFGLEDEAKMRRIIESNDAVIGELQNVGKLYTPRGNKNTTYEHWIAHDRDLIMKKDLDLMLDILYSIAPELKNDAEEYLHSNKFLGFNCFVLKKELFNELCEIEFKVLERLEKKTDLSRYALQTSRIYGFMGEIISSVYFHHLEKTGKYKVKHVPLVYFNYTDPLGNHAPLYPKDKNAIPVLFNHAESNPSRFGAIWQSFLDQVEPTFKYDVILLAGLEPLMKETFQNMAKPYKNVSLRFLDSVAIKASLYDHYGLKDDRSKRRKDPEDESDHMSALPYIPFILKNFDHMLVFDENILICDKISEIWKKHSATEKLIAAPCNFYLLSRINDIYYETAERYLDTRMKNPLNYFSINVFVWNFDKYRRNVAENKIAQLYPSPSEPGELCHREEIINILCEGDVEEVDARWNVWYETNDHLKHQLPYMPSSKYKELLAARKHPGVITYMSNDLWSVDHNELHLRFWPVARRTPFYELYLRYAADLSILRSKFHKRDLLVKLFPVNGRARGFLTRIFPNGSKQNKLVKQLLSKLHIR